MTPSLVSPAPSRRPTSQVLPPLNIEAECLTPLCPCLQPARRALGLLSFIASVRLLIKRTCFKWVHVPFFFKAI